MIKRGKVLLLVIIIILLVASVYAIYLLSLKSNSISGKVVSGIISLGWLDSITNWFSNLFGTSSSGTDPVRANSLPLTNCGELTKEDTEYFLQGDIIKPSTNDAPDGDCFRVKANHITLNFNGYAITGDGTQYGKGVYLETVTDVIVKGKCESAYDPICNTDTNAIGKINDFYFGVYLGKVSPGASGSDGNIIKNLQMDESGIVGPGSFSDSVSVSGIYIADSNENSIYNNEIKSTTAGQKGITLSGSSKKNILSNNDISVNKGISIKDDSSQESVEEENILLYENDVAKIYWKDTGAKSISVNSPIIFGSANDKIAFTDSIVKWTAPDEGDIKATATIAIKANVVDFNYAIIHNKINDVETECNSDTDPKCEFTKDNDPGNNLFIFSASDPGTYSLQISDSNGDGSGGSGGGAGGGGGGGGLGGGGGAVKPGSQCVTSLQCNDNIACTDDSCPNLMCSFTPNNNKCPPADVCKRSLGCFPDGCHYVTDVGAACIDANNKAGICSNLGHCVVNPAGVQPGGQPGAGQTTINNKILINGEDTSGYETKKLYCDSGVLNVEGHCEVIDSGGGIKYNVGDPMKVSKTTSEVYFLRNVAGGSGVFVKLGPPIMVPQGTKYFKASFDFDHKVISRIAYFENYNIKYFFSENGCPGPNCKIDQCLGLIKSSCDSSNGDYCLLTRSCDSSTNDYFKSGNDILWMEKDGRYWYARPYANDPAFSYKVQAMVSNVQNQYKNTGICQTPFHFPEFIFSSSSLKCFPTDSRSSSCASSLEQPPDLESGGLFRFGVGPWDNAATCGYASYSNLKVEAFGNLVVPPVPTPITCNDIVQCDSFEKQGKRGLFPECDKVPRLSDDKDCTTDKCVEITGPKSYDIYHENKNTPACNIPSQCVPKTCSELGKECGKQKNSCGGADINCPDCSGGKICNADGKCIQSGSCTTSTVSKDCPNNDPNNYCAGVPSCSSGTCVPANYKDSEGKPCTLTPPGTSPDKNTAGGSYICQNKYCVPVSKTCVPITKEVACYDGSGNKKCGKISNGCDGYPNYGMIDCGTCPEKSNTYCGDGTTQNPNGAKIGGKTGKGDEECDDGNTNDKKGNTDSGICVIDSSNLKNSCRWNVCGDGYLYEKDSHGKTIEQCDDGKDKNGKPGSSCDRYCQKEIEKPYVQGKEGPYIPSVDGAETYFADFNGVPKFEDYNKDCSIDIFGLCLYA